MSEIKLDVLQHNLEMFHMDRIALREQVLYHNHTPTGDELMRLLNRIDYVMDDTLSALRGIQLELNRKSDK